eukprot:4180821-Pyramimonas_sp.AAC.1
MDVGWHAPTATVWMRPVGDDEDYAEQWDIPSAMGGTFESTGCFQPLLGDFEAIFEPSCGRRPRLAPAETDWKLDQMYGRSELNSADSRNRGSST